MIAVVLDSIGLALSLFVACLLLTAPRRTRGGPFLSLSCLQAAILFSKELLDTLGAGRCDELVTFLIYVDFLFGLPSIYFFLRSMRGLPIEMPLRHYAPALANLPLAAAFAWTGWGSAGIDAAFSLGEGWCRLAPFFYANALAAAESIQLVVYALAGLKLVRREDPPRDKLIPRYIFIAVLSCYFSYYAVRWTGVAIRLFESPAGSIAQSPRWAGSAMIGVVAFFVAFFGFLVVADVELVKPPAVAAKKPRYGGKAMDGDESRKLVDRVLEALSLAPDLSDDCVSPRSLANDLGVPYYLLSRSVNELCGKSVSDLIRESRIERARGLLDARPGATILEVALESGFSAKSSFYDAFKRVMGMSPSEYLKREPRAEGK